MNGKVIITCALTGGIHDKRANPNLPEQPDEIIRQGVDAVDAGVAILHCHARNPDGSNTMDSEIFRRIHDGIKEKRPNAIVQLTTGGGLGLSVEERYGVIRLAPEMASLNMGLLNFVFNNREHFFSNMRSDIVHFATTMKEHDVKPELEVYNFAMIEEAEVLIKTGLLSPPYLINLVLHTPTQGGVRGTPQNLIEMVRRIPPDCRINVTACGAAQLPITTIAMAMGLNVRVGLEDNVLYRRGELAKSNAQLVERAVRIASELALTPATPDEARAELGLTRRVTIAAGSAR